MMSTYEDVKLALIDAGVPARRIRPASDGEWTAVVEDGYGVARGVARMVDGGWLASNTGAGDTPVAAAAEDVLSLLRLPADIAEVDRAVERIIADGRRHQVTGAIYDADGAFVADGDHEGYRAMSTMIFAHRGSTGDDIRRAVFHARKIRAGIQ